MMFLAAYTVSVDITADAPVTVVSNKTNDLHFFKGKVKAPIAGQSH